MKNSMQLMEDLERVAGEHFTGQVVINFSEGQAMSLDVKLSARVGRLRGFTEIAEQGGNGHNLPPEKTDPRPDAARQGITVPPPETRPPLRGGRR